MIKTSKILDITDVKDDVVRKALYDYSRDYELGQNSYIEIMVGEETIDEYKIYPHKKIIDDFLKENGMVENERIILLIWW